MHRYSIRTIKPVCANCGETNPNRLVHMHDTAPVLCAPCYLSGPLCASCGAPADTHNPAMCARCLVVQLVKQHPLEVAS